MTSLPITSNVAATDVPVSVVLELDLEDEDLEEIQCEMAATQQKIVEDAKAWMVVVKAHNEQKQLDWEKKEAKDKAK